MADPLQPNRIHSLPVQIHYQLSSSAQTFSTLLPTLAQVYVHAHAASSLDTDETWGSIYLKTVVEGIITASPEIHPAYPHAPDLSLYILDPRETYLRRSRATSSSSSSAPGLPRPAGASSARQPLVQEVWTGKGLTSWALDEPGQGKNLITGRLVQSADFVRVAHTQGLDPMEALMLADEHELGESWGIEIALSLRAGNIVPAPNPWGHASQSAPHVADLHRRLSSADAYPRPAHQQPQAGTLENKPRLMPTQSEPLIQHPQSEPVGPSDRRARQPPALSPARTVPAVQQSQVSASHTQSSGGSADGSAGAKRPVQPKRKKPQSSPVVPMAARVTQPNLPARSAAATLTALPPLLKSSGADSKPILSDDIARTLQNPEKLTKEQAERLISDPTFLIMLQQFTGQTVTPQSQAANNAKPEAESSKRARESSVASSSRPSKRTRTETAGEKDKAKEAPPTEKSKKAADKKADPNAPVPKCWNCGRTKSAVWRTKVMDETAGTTVRVCNACGLYWNKLRQMRPASLWRNDDDELMSAAGSSANTPAEDKAAQGEGSGFKRTLSAAVNQDARRLATSRRKPVIKARRSSDAARINPGLNTIQESPRASPATSPPRASARALPQTNGPSAASSPRWSRTGHREWTPPPQEGPARPNVDETPNTAMLRILGHDLGDVQSLAMPLSDDAAQSTDTQGSTVPSLPQFHQQQGATSATASFDWNSDLSAFLSTDDYSGAPASDSLPCAGVQETPGSKSATETGPFSSVAGKGRAPGSTSGTAESDDVLSQLFNRTSSIGADMSSPAAFDFSALPPSSPPVSIVSMDGLPHSALLLSSPDDSPLGYSPAGQEKRGTPEKSRLAQSFTPHDLAVSHAQMREQGQADKENRPPVVDHGVQGLSLEQIQELWSKMSADMGGKDGAAPEDEWAKVFHVPTQ